MALPTRQELASWLRDNTGPETVICGHDLRGDMEVLRIIPARVIDTTVLYPLRFFHSASERPSLENLSREILDMELRSPGSAHDPFDDASATRDLIVAAAKRGELPSPGLGPCADPGYPGPYRIESVFQYLALRGIASAVCLDDTDMVPDCELVTKLKQKGGKVRHHGISGGLVL